MADEPRDSDSVYLYSKSMALDHTLPLTAEDMALHRHTSVQGCYEVNRDPLQREDILDPEGNQAFHIELKYGQPVPMHRCTSRWHRGRRLVPASNFTSNPDVCDGCIDAEKDFHARHSLATLVKREPFWKALRVGKLGKGGKFLPS